ncbi:MAG: permease-like cell division protein FtsX [Ignavibacteriaceae bacterium]|nr:permease-like cell division protein FtsX [Ignavibacteriaceae bacterium]MCW8813869.1 permease-like cell division protein FtsX [Chlorobium sp.]MCW8817744.1 permease-like cell division protein FtsX [Ignavibacteriaceae bacterium]MCW8823649.1 permease-like cell division protein FtsX [Ignavibacteriaceae bacterium]MCW9094301.1 permease-like cell division protein FtsX [Ignavibacteriaceae bacterium]
MRSIKSAKTSFLLTIVSLTISALLILFCFITLQISDYYSTSLKSNIKINVFIKEAANKNDQEKLLGELQKKNYSRKVEFISKEAAAKKFIKETGEDFRKILDYNPLPASFVVKVSKEYANSDSLNFIIKDLSGLAMVDEVVFKEGFIYSLLNYIDRAKIYLFIITTIVFMVAVYLVYATVRLIINSRMNEFETMKLVGAKLATIKIPVVLNGLIAGLISGLLAFIIFIFFQDQIKSIGSLIKLVNENMLIYLMVIFLTGPLLVILVSVFTLRKVSLNI